jgi:hypothetical protein
VNATEIYGEGWVYRSESDARVAWDAEYGQPGPVNDFGCTVREAGVQARRGGEGDGPASGR